MVDVSGKDVTAREARASGRVRLSAEAVGALRAGTVPKGDALAVARIAGIQGAKRTPDLVPLCHPIALRSVTVNLAVTRSRWPGSPGSRAPSGPRTWCPLCHPIALHSVTVDLDGGRTTRCVIVADRRAPRTGPGWRWRR